MTDARIATSLPNHPKTKKLARRLGPAGPLACIYLFLWAADNRSNGDLSGMTDEDIEIAVDWAGAVGEFAAAMREVGFLDGDEGNRSIHNWTEHNPWAAGADMRSAKARWNAIKRHYGEHEADRKVPEWKAIRLYVAQPQHANSTAPSPSPSPSPSEEQTPPNGDAEPPAGDPPDDLKPDPIWGTGLAFLVRKRIPEKQARQLLGKLRKAAGDVKTGAILADCEAQDITDPAPWLMAAAVKARDGPTAPKSKTTQFFEEQAGVIREHMAALGDSDGTGWASLPQLGQYTAERGRGVRPDDRNVGLGFDG